jgi:hypothetical protein
MNQRIELDPTSRIIDLERDELLIYEKDREIIHRRFGGDCYNKNQPVQFSHFGYITEADSIINIGFYNPLMKCKVTTKPIEISDKKLWLYHILDTDMIIITDKNSVLVSTAKDVSKVISDFYYYVDNKTKLMEFVYFDDNLIISKEKSICRHMTRKMNLPLTDDILFEIEYKEFIDLEAPKDAATKLIQMSKSFKGQNELWAEAFRLWHLRSPKLDIDYYFELNDLDYISEIHTKDSIRKGSMGFIHMEFGNWEFFYQKDKNKIFVVVINEKFNIWKRRYISFPDWEIFLSSVKKSNNKWNLIWNEEYYRPKLQKAYTLRCLKHIHELLEPFFKYKNLPLESTLYKDNFIYQIEPSEVNKLHTNYDGLLSYKNVAYALEILWENVVNDEADITASNQLNSDNIHDFLIYILDKNPKFKKKYRIRLK